MKRKFFTRRKKDSKKTKSQYVVLDLSKETEVLGENNNVPETVVSKQSPLKKKNSKYLDAFMKPKVLKQRQSVYISQDVHEFISKVVKKVGVKNLTVGVFIDTVMSEHINNHADELRAIYYKEEKDIFENIVKNNEDD
jgi:Protein of unknown function (DUF3408).